MRADEEVLIEAVARFFLHNQVRSMVGSLVLVGITALGPSSSLGAASRSPKHGLLLMHIPVETNHFVALRICATGRHRLGGTPSPP
jgi:tRNA U38,U39,U40 pseudouridine synthase TruA